VLFVQGASITVFWVASTVGSSVVSFGLITGAGQLHPADGALVQ